MAFADPVLDVAQLRELYRPTPELVIRKQIDHVDAAVRDFVAAASFVVIATAGPAGADASPRGGPPGFVTVLDDHRLAFADLSGNNRLDSLTNLLASPEIGLLFIVPGMEETLRVNGRATLTTDPAVLEAVAVDGRTPRLAVGIDVAECYIHCAKSLRRSGIWDPSSWPAAPDRPSAAGALVDHIGLDIAPEVLAADLEHAYQVSLWEPGG